MLLKRNLNKTIDSLSDTQLKNWIEQNPKLKNLVTAYFDSTTGEIKNYKTLDEVSDLRDKIRFERDHIRGRSTVKYDPATKKIMDGIGIEYPKNLYIIPRGVNNATKRTVENYVALNPNEKTKIKKINKWFKDNDLTYYDRNNNKYSGATPKITNTDLSHLGLTNEQVLLSDKVNPKTGDLVIEKGPRLLERIQERNKQLKEIESYITDRTGKVKQPMLSSGFSGAYEMLSDDLKKIINSEGFKTFKAKIANPALKTAVGAAKLPTKIFGAADLVLGYLDYTNNRQKGFSKEDSTRHMVDAVLFGATSFGKKGDIEGVKKIAMQNGMSEEVFNNLVSVNLNQKAMIDRINESKAKFNESMDIIESGVGDTKGEQLLIQKLKVDTKNFLTNTMKDIVDDSRSLNTNLQVQEAGAPININVDRQKAFSDLGSSSREFVQKRIDASDPKVFEQGDTTMGKIGSTIKETVMQPDFYTGFFKKTKAQKDREDMEKLKIQDPTLYYKMLMSEGVDPRIKLNIPVQLEFERNNPEFGSQYSDALTQNKAEGGITTLRSKYEYKK